MGFTHTHIHRPTDKVLIQINLATSCDRAILCLLSLSSFHISSPTWCSLTAQAGLMPGQKGQTSCQGRAAAASICHCVTSALTFRNLCLFLQSKCQQNCAELLNAAVDGLAASRLSNSAAKTRLMGGRETPVGDDSKWTWDIGRMEQMEDRWRQKAE